MVVSFTLLALSIKKERNSVRITFLLAQEEGFEPPCLLGKRFSRPPRCDRFDIPAYIGCGLLHQIYAVLFRSGSRNSFHESASHTPRRCVKLACKQRVRVSSTEIILRCSKSSYRLLNCFAISTCNCENRRTAI